MKMRQESPEVYHSEEAVLRVGPGEIAFLKAAAEANPSGKARLCAHLGPEADLHEMIIVHRAGIYVRPHKHPGRTESFHVMEGACDVLLFDDAGGLEDLVPMGPPGSGLACYYRLSAPRFHTLLVRSGLVVFHETTQGPFRPGAAEFASWAPDPGEPGAAAYLALIQAAADAIRPRFQEESR